MANFSTYQQKSYDGGLNDSSSDLEIGRDEASYLRNWDITYKGQLRTRAGLTLYGDDGLTGTVNGFGEFYRNSTGTSDLLLIVGTTLYYLNSNTWTALDSGFTSETMCIEQVPAVNKVFISSATNTMHSWDRASTTLNSCLTDLGSSVPHGNIIKWHKNHMFVINTVTYGGSTYRGDIYWSAMGDPTTYDTANDFIPLPALGGKAITVGEIGDALVIFKERATLFLTGWGDDSWRITASATATANADEGVGTLSPFGGTKVGDEWWFIDDQANIRRIYQTDFDAFRKDIISTKLATTLGTVNFAQISKACAVTYDNKVFFAIPTGSNTTNSLVLVYDILASKRTNKEAWTVYEGDLWKPGFFTVYTESGTPKLLMASGAAARVYHHTGTSDATAAITCRWDGKLDNFDQPERYKKYAFGYITAPNQGDYDVTIHSSINGAAFSQISAFNLQGSGSTLGPTGTFELGPTGENRLGGSETLEHKYYFQDGGGSITGKSRKLSLRTSETGSVTVNTFTDHFALRSLR